jgi:hypothetical protein
MPYAPSGSNRNKDKDKEDITEVDTEIVLMWGGYIWCRYRFVYLQGPVLSGVGIIPIF